MGEEINPHDLQFVKYDEGDEPISCHVVGVKNDNSGFVIQRIRTDLDHTAFSVQATWRYMFACHDAEWVCVIYAGRGDDGVLRYVHKFRNDPPSDHDDLVRASALLQIAASGTGVIDENTPRAVERLLEDIETAKELGMWNTQQEPHPAL
jgi:hypothetical protein